MTAVFSARCSRARARRENPHQSFENCQKSVSHPTPLADLGGDGEEEFQSQKGSEVSLCWVYSRDTFSHRLMRTRDHLSLLLYSLFRALEGCKTVQLHKEKKKKVGKKSESK